MPDIEFYDDECGLCGLDAESGRIRFYVQGDGAKYVWYVEPDATGVFAQDHEKPLDTFKRCADRFLAIAESKLRAGEFAPFRQVTVTRADVMEHQ